MATLSDIDGIFRRISNVHCLETTDYQRPHFEERLQYTPEWLRDSCDCPWVTGTIQISLPWCHKSRCHPSHLQDALDPIFVLIQRVSSSQSIIPSGIFYPLPNKTTPRSFQSVLVMNLGRRVQPVIRYSSGELAEWVDYENGIFRVLGRATIEVRIGPFPIDIKHHHQIVASSLGHSTDLGAFQAVILRTHPRYVLTLRVGHQPIDEGNSKNSNITGFE